MYTLSTWDDLVMDNEYGQSCPICNSIEIDCDPLRDGDLLVNRQECRDCGNMWEDLYEYVSTRNADYSDQPLFI